MQTHMYPLRHLTASLAILAGVWGCAPTTSTSSGPLDAPLKPSQGRLVVELVDAPNRQVKEIWVTVSKVTAHSNTAGWVTVMNGDLTVDLLKLKTATQDLGFANLPSGKITQIRLYLTEGGPQYVTLPDGSKIDLKVPSGVQSGIKIKGPFDLAACANTVVTLDFDGHRSIWVHPTGKGEWILRPVIHAKKTVSTPANCLSGDGGESDDDDNDDDGDGDGDGDDNSSDGGSSSGDGDGGSFTEGGGSGSGGADGGSSGTGGTGGNTGTGSAGTPCISSSQCLSNACVNEKCAQGGPGSACSAGADCTSNQCVNAVCAPGSAGGTGSACTANSQCLSQTCTAGFCEEGGQGAPCNQSSDCSSEFTCQGGTCEVQFL